jgi:hypothetical protein
VSIVPGRRAKVVVLVALAVAFGGAAQARETAPPIPADALGLYVGAKGDEVTALVAIEGRLLYIARAGALEVTARRTPTGYELGMLPASAEAAGDDDDEDDQPKLPLPHRLTLLAPKGGDARWRMAPAPFLVQLRDPLAARITSRGERRELRAVDEKLLRARENLRTYTRLVRDRPAKELADRVSGIDPSTLPLLGGPVGSVVSSLSFELAEAVAPGEAARFAAYRRALERVAKDRTAMWPPRDDAFLLQLAARRWPTAEAFVLRGGSVMSLKVAGHPGFDGGANQCRLGVLVPDPSLNHSLPFAPFKAPAPGKLAYFPYVFEVFVNGAEHACDGPIAVRPFHAIKRGTLLLQLIGDSEGRVVGALFAGYMSAGFFVAPDTSLDALDAFLASPAAEFPPRSK